MSAVAKTRREPRGDMGKVRKAIVQGLYDSVTEAGHQGLLYVFDWHFVADFSKVVESEPVELVNAEMCLEVALNYVRELRHELKQQPRENECSESPF